jgi:hypothetical protein
MKNKYRIFLFFPLMFLLPAVLSAVNFSFITNQYAEAGNNNDDRESHFNEYHTEISPTFSFLFGEKGDFTFSPKVTLGKQYKIEDDEEKYAFFWTPELLRTEISWRSGAFGIRAGRMNYSDPIGFIASGLFDGVQIEYNSNAGIFSLGAWYTGFLYKKTAYTIMKDKEKVDFTNDVDLTDMSTYFASKRLLLSLDWEHLSVAELLHLNAAITAQFDLSNDPDDTEKVNSQYATLRAIIPVNDFAFELGGTFEIAEGEVFKNEEGVKEEDGVTAGFAGNLGVYWKLPSSFNSRLSMTGRFSSGRTKGFMKDFDPLTNKFYGDILKLKFKGITILGIGYSALFVPAFGIAFNVSHFVRNDLVTYKGYPLPLNLKELEKPEKDKYYGIFLGTEFFGQLVWSPASDLQLNLGGGIFSPKLGNTAPDEKPRWFGNVSVIIALY